MLRPLQKPFAFRIICMTLNGLACPLQIIGWIAAPNPNHPVGPPNSPQWRLEHLKILLEQDFHHPQYEDVPKRPRKHEDLTFWYQAQHKGGYQTSCFVGSLCYYTIVCYAMLYDTYYTIRYYTILYYAMLYYTILYYTILCHTILYYTILYYTILYYTILYYTILYYTILYYTILYYTILYYTILYYTILYYTILYYTVLYCTVLYCTVLYCTVLYCTVLYCTVLYHTTTIIHHTRTYDRPYYIHIYIYYSRSNHSIPRYTI